MTGQQLYRKIRDSVYQEEPMFIRALQGHSGDNLEERPGTISVAYWVLKNEDTTLVSPLDQNPGPKLKPYLHLKNHHDLLFVIDLETAQNSLEFSKQRKGDGAETKKRRRVRDTPKETSGHKSQDQEPLQTRQLGEIFSTAEFFGRTGNKDIEIYVQRT